MSKYLNIKSLFLYNERLKQYKCKNEMKCLRLFFSILFIVFVLITNIKYINRIFIIYYFFYCIVIFCCFRWSFFRPIGIDWSKNRERNEKEHLFSIDSNNLNESETNLNVFVFVTLKNTHTY